MLWIWLLEEGCLTVSRVDSGGLTGGTRELSCSCLQCKWLLFEPEFNQYNQRFTKFTEGGFTRQQNAEGSLKKASHKACCSSGARDGG